VFDGLTPWLARFARAFRRLRALPALGTPEPEPIAPGSASPITLTGPLPACACVVIPALNEAARIADVVRYALADSATAEVLVIDDSSTDDTAALAAAAGARVVRSTMLGKGASMKDGALAAEAELIVYLDGDLSGLRPGIVTDLLRPLVRDEADFVKARFGRGGGRVTELTAKPMLKVFFPELASFSQPLGGLIAARRSLLRALRFEDGYGVDVGLLIDAHRSGARLHEVDIGSLEHDSQPLLDLALMANEVARVIYSRARAAGRLNVDQIGAMYESQRQAAASLDYVLTRRRGRTRVLLLDMDGTLTPGRYVQALAAATSSTTALAALIDQPNADAMTRSEAIASLFRFVHKEQFERVARELDVRPGVIEFVREMRRAGFMVGVVSDSWFVAAEIVRRRIFADFALAHTLQFDAEVCNGQVYLNPAFRPPRQEERPTLCKSHVVARLREDPSHPRITEIWAIGDNANDLEMLRAADRAFVIEPKVPHLVRDADAQLVRSFEELLPLAAEAQRAPARDDSPSAVSG
jgi:glucosyl-3-phosphoglycerate synthase